MAQIDYTKNRRLYVDHSSAIDPRTRARLIRIFTGRGMTEDEATGKLEELSLRVMDTRNQTSHPDPNLRKQLSKPFLSLADKEAIYKSTQKEELIEFSSSTYDPNNPHYSEQDASVSGLPYGMHEISPLAFRMRQVSQGISQQNAD